MKFFPVFLRIILFSVLGEGIRLFAHLPIAGSILRLS
ncbi:CidA/LrgA family protein, partial [Enterococcus faecium]